MAVYTPLLTEALHELKERGIKIGPRENYVEGNHPFTLGSRAWNTAFYNILRGVKDNQVALVVNTRAAAVTPTNFTSADTDPFAEAQAQWASDLLDDNGDVIDKILYTATWSAEQTTVICDYTPNGDITWYTTDPRSCYVKLDRAGTYLWAVHLWHEHEHGPTHATIYTPETVAVLKTTRARVKLPVAEDFMLLDEQPNRIGDIPVACVELPRSIVDNIKSEQDRLNKSLQTQCVAGEAYVLPLTAFIGFETYNPDTGEQTELVPNLNPGTASRNISIPTVQDAEGGERKIVRLEGVSPEAFLAEQDAMRANIARLASVPAFMLQLSGNAPSGDALEMAYMPYIAAKTADERVYRPFFDRMAKLAVKLRLFQLTGGQIVEPPKMRVQFSTVATTTRSARVDQMVKAVSAGMTLADALVEFLGWSDDAAQAAQNNADEQSQASQDATSRMLFGGGASPSAV